MVVVEPEVFYNPTTGLTVKAKQLLDLEDSARDMIIWSKGRINRYTSSYGRSQLVLKTPGRTVMSRQPIDVTDWVFHTIENPNNLYISTKSWFLTAYERIYEQLTVWDALYD